MINFPFKDEYTNLWANMNIDPSKLDEFQKIAKLVISHKPVYQTLESQTGVPWDLIGVIHYRESDCDFTTHLHNGDPLTARTIHDPVGYPKSGSAPFSFQFSALDALHHDGLDIYKEWSIELRAYCLEKYNGFGYRNKKTNSPYLWAGTDQYTIGKFVSDRVYAPNVKDQQLGAMGIIKVILELDTTISTPTVNTAEVVVASSYKANENTTSKELSKVSRKWWIYNFLHNMFAGVFTSIAAGFSVADIPSAKNYLEQAKDFWVNYGLVGAFVICGIAIVALKRIKDHTKEDIAKGNYIPSGLTK